MTTWKPGGGSERKTQSTLPRSSEDVVADAGTGATRVGAVATAQRVGCATPNADADDDATPLRTESRRRPQPWSDTLTPTATAPPPTEDAAVDGTACSALPDPAATSRKFPSQTPEHAIDAGSCEQNPTLTPRAGLIAGATHRASPPQHDDVATRTMVPNWHEHRPPPPPCRGRDAPRENTTASPPPSATVPGLTARTEGAERTRAMNADWSSVPAGDSPSGGSRSGVLPSDRARGPDWSAKIPRAEKGGTAVVIVTGSSDARDDADASALGGASHRTNAELTHAPSPTSTATRPFEPEPKAHDDAPPAARTSKLTKFAPETKTTDPPLAKVASGRDVDASGRSATITSPPTPPATSSESATPLRPLRPTPGTHATWTTVNPGRR